MEILEILLGVKTNSDLLKKLLEFWPKNNRRTSSQIFDAFHASLFNIETLLVIVIERSWVGNSGISIDILWISGDGIRCFLADLEAPA